MVQQKISETEAVDQTTGEITVIDKAIAELATITDPAEILKRIRQLDAIRDILKAEGAELDKQQRAAELRLWHIRRIGELLAAVERSVGGRPSENSAPKAQSFADVLAELGLHHKHASRWQVIARYPLDAFRTYIESQKREKKEITAAEVYRLQRKAERAEAISDLVAATIRTDDDPGPFDVLIIDPPWPYGTAYDPNGRRAANPYPEMSLEELAEKKPPASDDCVLWLWTTHAFMRHAFPLLDKWGFRDVAILTWRKDKIGLGQWLRSQSEFCVMAVKGSPQVHLTNQNTVIDGPVREHSRKPDEFYDLVRGLCIGNVGEAFQRTPRPWITPFWSNESSKFRA